jgi:hypothetical protein
MIYMTTSQKWTFLDVAAKNSAAVVLTLDDGDVYCVPRRLEEDMGDDFDETGYFFTAAEGVEDNHPIAASASYGFAIMFSEMLDMKYFAEPKKKTTVVIQTVPAPVAV